jgi:2-hydroxychromene-2-carboxylate isomerase
LNARTLEAAMRLPDIDRALAHNAALAAAIGAFGTPAYVVDGVIIAVGFSPEVVLELAARHTPDRA